MPERNVITVTVVAMLVMVAGLLSGCHKEQRTPTVEPVESRRGDKGTTLAAADLAAASDQAVQGIAAVPEILKSSGRTIIVMDRVLNRTSDPTADFQIFLARIRARLNVSGNRKHLMFVESRKTAEAIRAREGQDVATTRARPEYALHAIFYDMPRGQTNYYLLTFQLVNLTNDLITWEDSYEVKLKY